MFIKFNQFLVKNNQYQIKKIFTIRAIFIFIQEFYWINKSYFHHFKLKFQKYYDLKQLALQHILNNNFFFFYLLKFQNILPKLLLF